MSPLDLLIDLYRRGLKVETHGGDLRISPRRLLSDADRAALRVRKPELVLLLSAPLLWAKLPPEWQQMWEERAAIMEFDGGLSREEAEREAWVLVSKRYRLH